ncbi:hypothetical protein [Herbidospora mongoliensis]|uniref:hypothetical protein n=1 Tax=Herbidospora mongoliensis TaxID=688067 RepID=UPI0008349580|nr:hypothetical protein [Herbidospora mongoliensis]
MKLSELAEKYGRRWDITGSGTEGWTAVRRQLIRQEALDRGLSNVRCGNTLEDLAARLKEEEAAEWKK